MTNQMRAVQQNVQCSKDSWPDSGGPGGQLSQGSSQTSVTSYNNIPIFTVTAPVDQDGLSSTTAGPPAGRLRGMEAWDWDLWGFVTPGSC